MFVHNQNQTAFQGVGRLRSIHRPDIRLGAGGPAAPGQAFGFGKSKRAETRGNANLKGGNT
jgi:hypothetical protein